MIELSTGNLPEFGRLFLWVNELRTFRLLQSSGELENSCELIDWVDRVDERMGENFRPYLTAAFIQAHSQFKGKSDRKQIAATIRWFAAYILRHLDDEWTRSLIESFGERAGDARYDYGRTGYTRKNHQLADDFSKAMRWRRRLEQELSSLQKEPVPAVVKGGAR